MRRAAGATIEECIIAAGGQTAGGAVMKTFSYRVFDRKFGGESISHGSIDARNKTEARATILRDARRNHDVPTNARDCGYVPLRDWRIVFNVEAMR